MSSKKIQKLIRMSPEIDSRLREYTKAKGMSQTAVVEQALDEFMSEDKTASLVATCLDAFDERYGNFMTRVRLGVRTSDINSQILLDIANTMLNYNGIAPEAYVSVNDEKHDIIRQSDRRVKEIIANAKQRKDDR